MNTLAKNIKTTNGARIKRHSSGKDAAKRAAKRAERLLATESIVGGIDQYTEDTWLDSVTAGYVKDYANEMLTAYAMHFTRDHGLAEYTAQRHTADVPAMTHREAIMCGARERNLEHGNWRDTDYIKDCFGDGPFISREEEWLRRAGV